MTASVGRSKSSRFYSRGISTVRFWACIFVARVVLTEYVEINGKKKKTAIYWPGWTEFLISKRHKYYYYYAEPTTTSPAMLPGVCAERPRRAYRNREIVQTPFFLYGFFFPYRSAVILLSRLDSGTPFYFFFLFVRFVTVYTRSIKTVYITIIYTVGIRNIYIYNIGMYYCNNTYFFIYIYRARFYLFIYLLLLL